MALCELHQPAAPHQPALFKWQVGHHGDAALTKPWQQVPFNAAPAEVVENLVGLHRRAGGHVVHLVHERGDKPYRYSAMMSLVQAASLSVRLAKAAFCFCR